MRSPIERRLRKVAKRIATAKEDLRVTDEHLAHLLETTDDLRLRSMVSDSPRDQADHSEAELASSAMSKHRSNLIELLARLDHEQDQLLDRLSADRR